jgi:excisionase family DNA binding protein
MEHQKEGMLRRREAASLLGLSVDTVDRLIRDGQLGAVRVGHAVLIPRHDVTALVERRALKPRRPRAPKCAWCHERIVGHRLVVEGMPVCAACIHYQEHSAAPRAGQEGSGRS